LVHYGLSPEAVLINIDDNTRKPQVLLLDLGIAATSEEELKKHWYGKFILPAYAAPELVDYILPDADNASPRYAATTEVYGLGVLMYELLEGLPSHFIFGTTERFSPRSNTANRQTSRTRPLHRA
jgi:hypothetical protein